MLNGKVVVVTGGAGLLGRHFCEAIAEQGGVVVVADLDNDAASQVAKDICAKFPDSAEAASLDITDQSSVNRLITDVTKKHGSIDAVVNNAYPRNRNYGRKLEEVVYEDFCENISLHLGGYFLVAQQFGIFFRKQGYGNIINMSSIYGSMAPRFDVYADTSMTMPVEYSAIKSSVIQLTRYFAQYYKGQGIRVNCISPGGIIDNQPEKFLMKYNEYCNKKGMLEPKDLNGSLLYLLSDTSEYVTGQNMVVDDGYSL